MYLFYLIGNELELIVVFILWFVFSVILALVAKANGRSFIVWFILSIIIDPILAVILYWIIEKNK